MARNKRITGTGLAHEILNYALVFVWHLVGEGIHAKEK